MHAQTLTHMQEKSYSCHRQAILTTDRQPSPMCSFYYSLAYELHRTPHFLTVCMCGCGGVYTFHLCLWHVRSSFFNIFEGEIEDKGERHATFLVCYPKAQIDINPNFMNTYFFKVTTNSKSSFILFVTMWCSYTFCLDLNASVCPSVIQF